MKGKKRILLKLTGKLLETQHASLIQNMLENILQLKETHHFGIVIGGGNFFRGHQHGKAFGLRPAAGHTAGMLATIMNGVLLNDLMHQAHIPSKILSAIPCESIAQMISQRAIDDAYDRDEIIIFVGGTGNPFFTTDTNAIMRALQIHADEVWKATNIDGIYTADPYLNTDAQKLNTLTHQEAISLGLGIMDQTALTLAKEHNMPIRVFNLFGTNSLLKMVQSPYIGSIIESKDIYDTNYPR